MKTKMMPDAWYDGEHDDHRLDVGIRFPVRVLHAAGLETCQSCEGGPGHAYHEPSVDLVDDEGAGLRAVAALREYGID